VAAIVASLAGLAIARPALAAGHSGAASTGTIDGNLVDGTRGGAPISGQTVALMLATGANERQVATAVTDGQGQFRFTGLATDPTDIYIATVQYQGAPYATDPLTLSSDSNARVTLLAYEATNSDARIGIAQVVFELQQRRSDVLSGAIHVSVLVTVVNGDQRAYVGTPGPADGKPMDLLRFALPTGATDLVTSDGFGSGQILQVDHGFATTAPVLPGETRFAFTYSYPYHGTRALFTYQAIYPTLQVAVFAPPTIGIATRALAPQGTVSAGGSPVQVWQGQNVPAGSVVAIALSKLPVPGESSDLNLALLYWLAGFLAVLALGLVGYHLMRERRGIAVASAGVAASRGPGASVRGSVNGAESSAATAGSTEDLLVALAKLDRAREAGKLDEEHYRARRAAIKGELKARLLAAEPPAAGGGR
jgi:hypothetical protein